MKNKHYIFIGIVTLISNSLASGNISPRIKGLENDSVYMHLISQEKILKIKEDSLMNLLDLKRTAFIRDTTDRAYKSTEILGLESELFDTRNNLGVVVSRTNIIEQEFLINSLGKDDSTVNGNVSKEAGNAFLPDNDYIKNNLSQEDYQTLLSTFQKNNTVHLQLNEFSELYSKMEILKNKYETADNQNEADSLYTVYNTVYRGLKSSLLELENSFKENWEFIFSNKSYIYTLLLDNLNKLNEVNEINRKHRELMLSSDKLVTKVSRIFAEFPSQYRQIYDYEKLIAQTLHYLNVVDSLDRVISNFDDDSFIKENINIKERDFVDYSNISKASPYPYNVNNIPEMQLPDKGRFYSITVGSFTSRPGISTFKNIIPIYQERTQGRYRYYLGLYKTLSDAYADALILKDEYGFRKPEVAVWINGQYSNLAEELEKNNGSYNVELHGATILTDPIKEYINKFAKDKELTLVDNRYSIGIFSNRMLAEELAEALNNLPAITASVSEIE